MNPAHEALSVVVEMADNLVRGGITHVREEIGVEFASRIRGIAIASRGLDGNGIPRSTFTAPGDVGWCSGCGAYHKLDANAMEVGR